MNANDSDSAHKVYNNDPVSLKSYVNKSMLIKTRDGRDHTGVVYTVDPVSERLGFLTSSFSSPFIIPYRETVWLLKN